MSTSGMKKDQLYDAFGMKKDQLCTSTSGMKNDHLCTNEIHLA